VKFLDEITIEVRAGDGGAGMSHFRREKFVPHGGPDGGDGGKGGSVILVADRNKHTLLDFRYKKKWHADNGQKGGTNNRTGADGSDLIIPVPVGTEVYLDDSLVVDLNEDETSFSIAKGGRGGRGNAFFKSSTNRAPEKAQPGEKGEEGIFLLSLKLIADVGLIGLPNAGKSSLISRISEARPKVADYPFTTLVPNLGVAKNEDGRSFVVADIPGLIPGAHEGKGLGIQFLKHVERTRILLHLIDLHRIYEDELSGDPLKSFNEINLELREFSSELAAKTQRVVFTKADAPPHDWDPADAIKQFKNQGYKVHLISSVTGEGVKELLREVAKDVFSEG